MKHISTMKHIFTISYRKSLICALTLVCVLCTSSLYAEDRTYGYGEQLYIKKAPDWWTDFGDGIESGKHYFAYFFRGEGNAWSTEAVTSEFSSDYMQVTVPQGKWSHVILVCKDNATQDWDGDKVQTGDIELSNNVNYLKNFKKKGEVNDWDKEWRFLHGTGESLYFKKSPDDWSGYATGGGGWTNYFAYYYGDGEAWSKTATPVDFDSNIMKVNVPTGCWTNVILVRKNNPNQDWSESKEQTGNIVWTTSDNYLQNFKKGSTDH